MLRTELRAPEVGQARKLEPGEHAHVVAQDDQARIRRDARDVVGHRDVLPVAPIVVIAERRDGAEPSARHRTEHSREIDDLLLRPVGDEVAGEGDEIGGELAPTSKDRMR
jgi:hypothetical protein